MRNKFDPFETMNRENLLAFIGIRQSRSRSCKVRTPSYGRGWRSWKDNWRRTAPNSSKPPSSDGLKKPNPKSRREKGKRKSGGQAGHEGETLAMVASPDQVVVHTPQRCGHCQHDLSAIPAVSVRKRQVFDLPPLRLQVTEHQAEVKVCPHCGQLQAAVFPAGVQAPTQYGPNVLAQVVYLHSYQLLPLARLREWFADCVGQAVSEGTLQRALQQMAQAGRAGPGCHLRRRDRVRRGASGRDRLADWVKHGLAPYGLDRRADLLHGSRQAGRGGYARYGGAAGLSRLGGA